MAPYAKGCRDGVVLTNQRIVGHKIYTLSLLLITSFLIHAAFLWASNRMDMNYGAFVNLSKEKKRTHFQSVTRLTICNWTTSIWKPLQFWAGLSSWDKLWNNQQYGASDICPHSIFFHSTSLETIEKELIISAKEYHSMNKHRSIMKILDRSTPSDMHGAQDVQSYSP